MSYGLGHEVNYQVVNNKDTFGDVSSRYIQTSSQDIINEINTYGNEFKPVGFAASNVRKQEKAGKQKHMIMLQEPNAELLDGTTLRLVMFNSSDRSSGIKLYSGAIRDACANSLVFSDDILEPISIIHTKQDWQSSIKELMSRYEESKQKSQEMIQAMMHRYMSAGDMERFSHRVADMINEDITGTIIDPMQLNIAQRNADVGKDLWHTFNRHQSGALNGNIRRLIKSKELQELDLGESYSNTHKITNPQKIIQYNQEIHSMAMDLL